MISFGFSSRRSPARIQGAHERTRDPAHAISGRSHPAGATTRGQTGEACRLSGDHVQRGDVIAEADGFVSSPVHASAAGVVQDIELWPHPDGSMCPAIRIKVDRWSAQMPRPRLVPKWEDLGPQQIVAAVQNGGVVGLEAPRSRRT